MSFVVEGDYFEVCNCDVSCNCEVAGMQPATITFEKADGSLHAEVAGALAMSGDQMTGMDGAQSASSPSPSGRRDRKM